MMKQTIKILLLIILIIGTSSCDRVKRKTEQVTGEIKKETTNQIKNQSKKIGNKIFPKFDSDKADTENNKQRFKDFIKVEITPDVKNIYCFDDAIGIDADYMFLFDCDSLTSKKIIEMHNLVLDTVNFDNGFGMQHDFEWWDKDRIAELQKYSWTDGKQYHKYYWYDKEKGKAYFFDFDM